MPRRAIVVGFTFVLAFLLYVDRVCISTAQRPIMAAFDLTNTQFGWLLSVFAFGYALFQVPAGAFADRQGPRGALAVIVAAWSLFTGLTAAAWNFAALLAVRFCFGASEAGAFPGMAQVAYSWIPVRERGLVKGINFSASRLGAAVTMPILPWMVQTLGWKQAFATLTAVGTIWAAAWWLWFRDDPTEDPKLSGSERAYILAARQHQGKADEAKRRFATGNLLRQREVLLLMMQYFASNFAFFFCLSWLFPFVQRTYHIAYETVGLYAMAPLLAGAAGNIASGGMVDALYRFGFVRWSRRLPAMLGFGLAGAGLLGSAYQTTAGGAVGWLSVATFGADMTLSPSWSACIDLGGPQAGQVSGIMNMAGNLGAALVALAFPYLLQWTGSTHAFFEFGALLCIGSIGVWLLVRPNHHIAIP